MAIKKITLCIGRRETYEVGNLYDHRIPAHGIIARIEYSVTDDSFYIYSSVGGYKKFYDKVFVDPDSVVEE